MAGSGRTARRLPSKPVPVVREKYLTGPTLNVTLDSGNLGQRYLNFLTQNPEKIHQVDAQTGTTETKGFLKDRALLLVNAMIKKGIKIDDEVVICSKCHMDMTVTLLACLIIGAIVIPINTDFTLEELQTILSTVTPKLGFCDLRTVGHVDRCMKKLHHNITLIVYGNERKTDMIPFSAFVAEPSKNQKPTCHTIDMKSKICFLLPTQGSTGAIKLCQCTEYAVLARTKVWLDCFLDKTSKVLSYLAINSPDQIIFICSTFETNITRILPSSFTARSCCKVIHDLQIDTTILSTDLAMQLFFQHAGVYDFDLSCLSSLLIFGCAISISKVKLVMNIFPSVQIYGVYGLTESGPISYTITSTAENIDESIGKLVPGIQIYIKNSETHEHLGPGVIGDLMVGGPQLTIGYYKNQHLNTTSFRRGFLQTGDLVSYDQEGNINVKGNKMDILLRNDKIFPAIELEDLILKYHGIHEVAIVSNNKEIVACVVKKDSCNVTVDILQKFLDEKVPEIWLPNRLVVFDHFPKTTLGKVKKYILMEKVFKYQHDESEVSSVVE